MGDPFQQARDSTSIGSSLLSEVTFVGYTALIIGMLSGSVAWGDIGRIPVQKKPCRMSENIYKAVLEQTIIVGRH